MRYRNDIIRSAWVDWLGELPWQWFVTYTFADRKHPESADKAFRYWMSKFQQVQTGANHWYKPRNKHRTIRWIRGLEWQKRGVIHYHALMYAPPASTSLQVVSRTEWVNQWHHIAGGFARIDHVSGAAGALSYLTKYAVKGAAIDISRDICVESETPRPLPGV